MSAVKNKYHDILESMSRDRVLVVYLTHQWFAQFETGYKKEEYRYITDYWRKRLLKEPYNKIDSPKFKDFDFIDIRKGYTSTRMIYEVKAMDVRRPNMLWSPKSWWDENVFVISVGDLVYSNVNE